MSQLSDSWETNLNSVGDLLGSELGNDTCKDWGKQDWAEAEIIAKWITDVNVTNKTTKLLGKKNRSKSLWE